MEYQYKLFLQINLKKHAHYFNIFLKLHFSSPSYFLAISSIYLSLRLLPVAECEVAQIDLIYLSNSRGSVIKHVNLLSTCI